MPNVVRPNQPTISYELDDFTDPWKESGVILLQHGFSRSSRFWYSWVPYLSRFYRVVRPDMRGFGASSRNLDLERDVTPSAYLDDILAIIDHLGVQTVHYCGESLGGLLGMAFAARHPDRVRTLTVVAAPPYISEHDKRSTTYGHASRIEALRKMGPRAWSEASNAGRRFPPDADPGLLRWYVDEMGRGDVELLVAMTRWMSEFTAVPVLPKIAAPVLGLYPCDGPVTDQEQLRILHEGLKDFRVVTIPTRYHAIQNILPATCATTVLSFVAQHDGIVCRE